VDTIPDAWELSYFSDLAIINDTTDYDGDGLPDIDEYTHGTDPLQSDSDGDGMPEGWEVDNGLDPLTDDAVEDADTDGYSNLREYLALTDPSDDQDQPLAWGDIDGDQDVDGSDLATLSTEMGRTDCSAATPCACDLDQDGDVDNFDLLFFSEDFGKIIP